MTITAKELRFNTNMLFDLLKKGEEITITYRGKATAKLIPAQQLQDDKDNSLFGIWSDRDEDIDNMVRDLRKGRNFDL